jgi:hypothetical protein
MATIKKIKDYSGFVNYIKQNVVSAFIDSVNHHLNSPKMKKLKQQITDEDLPQKVIDSELDIYVFTQHGVEGKFIVQEDIPNLVKSLTNELFSRFMGKLVDQGIMKFCWDNRYRQFIWIPIKKQRKNNVKGRRTTQKRHNLVDVSISTSPCTSGH